MSKLKRTAPLLIIAVIIGIIGSITLFLSHASTPNVAIETETGSTVCAGKVLDTTASGGQAVKFQACAATGGLDSSGKTIPDTNYAIPSSNVIYMAANGNDALDGSSISKPVKTLNKAVSLVPSGGTIIVRGGSSANPTIYRDWYHVTNSKLGIEVEGNTSKSFTIQPYPHERAWFDGTDVIAASKWTSDGSGHWVMNWNTPSFCDTSPTDTVSQYYSQPLTQETQGPCAYGDMSRDKSNLLAKDPQMVFIDGAYAHEATSLSAVSATSFYYDWSAKKIYIGTNPANHTLELASRPAVIELYGKGTTVRGLGFKRYATDEFDNNGRGAIISGGANQLFENNVFAQMAGGGMGLSSGNTNAVFNHNVYAANGFDGLRGSTGDNFTFQNNVVNNNNTELFGTDCGGSCAQAGLKIAHTDGFLIKNNLFTNNYGQGFWCDLDCNHGVIVNNIADGNFFSGLMYEVSDNGVLASNLITNNGVSGIRMSSAHTRIYNNTLINNGLDGGDKGGHGNVWIYDDNRTPVSGQTGPNTTGTSFVNNVVYTSGSADTIRIFSSQTGPADAGFFAAINHNSYYRAGGSGKPLFIWDSKTFTSISALKAAYPNVPMSDNDDTGPATDPFFINFKTKAFQLRSGSSAYNSGAAIPSDIAQAVGASGAAGQNRGVLVWTSIP